MHKGMGKYDWVKVFSKLLSPSFVTLRVSSTKSDSPLSERHQDMDLNANADLCQLVSQSGLVWTVQPLALI